MRQRGYTIIEILVVMVIVGIVFTGGYAAYREFNRRAAIDAATKGLVSDLRLAQEKAISGDKPTECTQQFVGYRFTLVSESHYLIEAICLDRTVLLKEVDAPDVIRLTMTPVSSITFQSIGRGTDITPGSNIAIEIARVGIPRSQIINIGPGGEITKE